MSRFMVVPNGDGFTIHDELGEYDPDMFDFKTREFSDGFVDAWNRLWEATIAAWEEMWGDDTPPEG